MTAAPDIGFAPDPGDWLDNLLQTLGTGPSHRSDLVLIKDVLDTISVAAAAQPTSQLRWLATTIAMVLDSPGKMPTRADLAECLTWGLAGRRISWRPTDLFWLAEHKRLRAALALVPVVDVGLGVPRDFAYTRSGGRRFDLEFSALPDVDGLRVKEKTA